MGTEAELTAEDLQVGSSGVPPTGIGSVAIGEHPPLALARVPLEVEERRQVRERPVLTAGPDQVAARALEVGLKRLQLLSWRDLDAPDAGGQEIHADRVASIWAAAGLDVTVRSQAAGNLESRVVRNGYEIVRRAGRMTVFPRVALKGLLPQRNGPDGLMEIWHGMPFFSPLWARCPRIAFVHHVHADTWRVLLPGPMARVGEFMELGLAPRVYRRTRMVTPSASTRDDLVSILGLNPLQVTVVPNGIDTKFSPGGSRSPEPLVVAVGRLSPVKRFHLLVDTLVEARRQVPELRAMIVGEGYQRPLIEAKIQEAGATGWIELAGFLPDEELVDAYRRAWVVASTSAREGWNLTITEAAACGTPAVVTDIAGHRDTVWQGVSGLRVELGEQFTAALVRVLRDGALRARLGQGALERSRLLTWEATAAGTLTALVEEAEARL